MGSKSRVQSLGFRVQSSGFRVQGSGLRVLSRGARRKEEGERKFVCGSRVRSPHRPARGNSEHPTPNVQQRTSLCPRNSPPGRRPALHSPAAIRKFVLANSICPQGSTSSSKDSRTRLSALPQWRDRPGARSHDMGNSLFSRHGLHFFGGGGSGTGGWPHPCPVPLM